MSAKTELYESLVQRMRTSLFEGDAPVPKLNEAASPQDEIDKLNAIYDELDNELDTLQPGTPEFRDVEKRLSIISANLKKLEDAMDSASAGRSMQSYRDMLNRQQEDEVAQRMAAKKAREDEIATQASIDNMSGDAGDALSRAASDVATYHTAPKTQTIPPSYDPDGPVYGSYEWKQAQGHKLAQGNQDRRDTEQRKMDTMTPEELAKYRQDQQKAKQKQQMAKQNIMVRRPKPRR